MMPSYQLKTVDENLPYVSKRFPNMDNTCCLRWEDIVWILLYEINCPDSWNVISSDGKFINALSVVNLLRSKSEIEINSVMELMP